MDTNIFFYLFPVLKIKKKIISLFSVELLLNIVLRNALYKEFNILDFPCIQSFITVNTHIFIQFLFFISDKSTVLVCTKIFPEHEFAINSAHILSLCKLLSYYYSFIVSFSPCLRHTIPDHTADI